ncbi:uncharacterized protein V1513DRAFT_437170 [Lipomyces chichibuensis]|uniref:uncharacterized protein n=1 Tax=Lipomyces chichibuensis TaxID=1546026 RepID=UPI003343D16D
MVNDSFQLQWGRLSASEFTIGPDKQTAPHQYNSVPRTSILPLATTIDYDYSAKMYSTVSNYYSSAASNESTSSTSSSHATPNFTSSLVDVVTEDDVAPYHSHVEVKQERAAARAWSPELEQLVDERMGSSRVWSGNMSVQPAQCSPTSWIAPRVKLEANSRSNSTASTASATTSASSISSEQTKALTATEYFANYYHNSYYTGFGTDTKIVPSFQAMPEKNYTTINTSTELPTGFGLDFDVGLNLAVPVAPSPLSGKTSTDSSSASPLAAISTIPELATTMSATVTVPSSTATLTAFPATSTTSTTPTTTITTTTVTTVTAAQAQAQARADRRQGHNRNYRCRHCALVFSDAASLKQHIALLPDATVSQRPYKCPEPSCDWHVIGFHRNNDCSRHYRQVHGVREFVCRWQGARECRTHRFVTAWLRNRHERTVHACEMQSLGLDPDSGKDRTGARKKRKIQGS